MYHFLPSVFSLIIVIIRQTIANLEKSHTLQMSEQKKALEDFAKQKELIYRQNEVSNITFLKQ